MHCLKRGCAAMKSLVLYAQAASIASKIESSAVTLALLHCLQTVHCTYTQSVPFYLHSLFSPEISLILRKFLGTLFST